MLQCCKEKREVNGKAKRENKKLRNQRPFFEDCNTLPRSDSGVDDGNTGVDNWKHKMSAGGDLSRDGDHWPEPVPNQKPSSTHCPDCVYIAIMEKGHFLLLPESSARLLSLLPSSPSTVYPPILQWSKL